MMERQTVLNKWNIIRAFDGRIIQQKELQTYM